MFCKYCGQKQTLSDGKFCQFCGIKIKNDTNKEPSETERSTVEKHEEGTSPAESYFENHDDELLQEAKKASNNMMLQGVVWFILGLIITGITYSSADEGGTYYVLWGAMIFGVYKFLRGLYYRIYPTYLIQKAIDGEKK